MKRKYVLIFFILILLLIILNQNVIVTYIAKNFLYKNEVVVPEYSYYHLDTNFNYVKETNDFVPKNKQDLLNIVYTILNNGWDSFTFYCSEEYISCKNDVNSIFKDQSSLSHLNNFVHPYNTYNTITADISSLGRIKIDVKKLYSENMIKQIDEKVNSIYKEIIKDDMSDRDKILAVHDYIINNTVYDEERSNAILSGDKSNNNSNSHSAYGLLYEGKAICGGYADTMALFLDKMGITNMKIATYDHVWNAVLLDGVWYHLDLTWDDPVSSSGENILTHTFFLLTSEQLASQNTGQHNYDKKIYSEI